MLAFYGWIRESVAANKPWDRFAREILTAAGAGGSPHVRAVDGGTGAVLAGPLGSFFAFDPAFTGGVFVTGYR